MTLISDITAKLIALGFISGIGVDCWPLRFPPSPLKCICIIPLSGKVPSEEMGGTGIDYPGFQIQVRDTVELTALTTAEAIRLALNGSIAGSYSIFTTRSQPSDVTSPEDLGATDGPVFRFSCDFETILVR
jgi:hypothetical protein